MAPHSHPFPAPGGSPRPSPAGVSARLPWWAVALPAVAFAVLLAVIARPGHPEAVGTTQPLTVFVGHLREALPPALSALL